MVYMVYIYTHIYHIYMGRKTRNECQKQCVAVIYIYIYHIYMYNYIPYTYISYMVYMVYIYIPIYIIYIWVGKLVMSVRNSV